MSTRLRVGSRVGYLTLFGRQVKGTIIAVGPKWLALDVDSENRPSRRVVERDIVERLAAEKRGTS